MRAGDFPFNLAFSPVLHASIRPSLRPMKPAAVQSVLRGGLLAGLTGALLFLAGCATVPRPGTATTFVAGRSTTLPARIISNFFVIESAGEDGRTDRFIVDTGSTATLVAPDLAKRLGLKPRKNLPPAKVKVRSASGGEIDLEPVTLRRVVLGAAVFANVPALIFDFTDLSAHLGVPIDGLISFPFFRETLLTMDYPGQRLLLAPAPLVLAKPAPAPRAATIAFDNGRNTPLISLQMGNESFIAQIDTGSDGSLSLNSTGLHPRFANGPRPGTLISSLQGDRQQLTGRLSQNVLIGSHTIEQPIVDLTAQLSSIGGEFLRHFILTFDQRHNQVTLVRDTDGSVTMEPRRSTGLSFSRSSAYWRVLSVIPDTPTAQLPVQAGDLCIRINGEPVKKWTFDRYAALVKSAVSITYTFLIGTRETDLETPVFELVP